MADFPPALAHGELRELFGDVFLVSGAMKVGPGMSMSRNMTVVRRGGNLVLINTLRLSEPGLAALDKLGKVTHVVRLAGFHGRDDAFYKDRYSARVLCVAGQVYSRGFKRPKPEDIYFTADATLDSELASVLDHARLHVFASKPPEGLLVLDRDGGIAIAGDSLQNWATTDEYFSLFGKLMMKMLGFIKPANVGPGWLKQAKPPAADLQAVLAMKFEHLLPAHGAPMIGGAAAALKPALERAVATRSA